MRRAVPLLVLLAAGCGGGSPFRHEHAPRPAGDAAVIRRWAETLRAGDVAGAARLFTVPTEVQNGTPVITLRSRAAVRFFNQTLPCGARLERTIRHHGYLIATFKLTDRQGPGAVRPCQGRGNEAATAFRIVRGRIAEWRRVPTPADQTGPAPTDRS